MGILVAVSIISYSASSQNSGLTYITVSATGSAQAAPQIATIYVLMNGTGQTTQIATDNLSLTVAEFNNSISRYIGANTTRLTTQSYSVYMTNGSYVAMESVSVNLPNTLNVSSAIGTLSQLKNVYVQGVSTRFSDQQVSSLTSQALTAAMANATSQASILAPNKTLMARNITVSRSYVYPVYGLNAAAASASSNPLYFSGSQSMSESITEVFSYK